MNNAGIIEMEMLSPVDLRGLDRDRTCFVLPFAPIEYHGDHLPLGTDVINARVGLRGAAKKFATAHPEWKFVFTPVIPLGADVVPHGGSLGIKPGTLRMVAEELAAQIIAQGFRYIALFSGHGGYRQMIALEEAAQNLRRKFRAKKARVFSPITYLLQRGATIDFVDRLNSLLPEPLTQEESDQIIYESHGGRLETSFILSAAPEWVSDDYRQAEDNRIELKPLVRKLVDGLRLVLPENLHGGAEALAAAMTWFFGGAEKGYMGFPSGASKELGDALYETVSGILFEMLEEVLINDRIPKEGSELFHALRIFTR